MKRTIFRNANLLDGKNPARRDSTVVVEGERITQVGRAPAREVAPGDRVIDLAGRTLMPGMGTCHFHASYHDYALDVLPLGIDKPPGYLMLRAARAARQALHCGFTMVVGAGDGHDIDSQLKLAIEDGVTEGPRILAGSRWITTRGGYVDLDPWWWGLANVGPTRVVSSGPEALREAVRDEIRRGAEMIKVYPTGGHGDLESPRREYTRAELQAVVEAAHERGKKVRAHCAWKPFLLECLELGVDVIDHGDEVDEECLSRMVENGTTFAPSALYLEKLLGLEAIHTPANARRVERTQRELDNLLRRVPEAQAAGVRIVLGDDYGVAFLPHGSYAEELEFYVKRAGVAALDVLRWATVNAAELMGCGDELGSIETGKLADLLVVDGDPSADIRLLQDARRLLAVVKGGVFVKDELGGGAARP